MLFLVSSRNQSGAAECVSRRGYWELVQSELDSDVIKLPDSGSQTALGAASGLGAEAGLCAASSSSSSRPPVPPLHLPGQQTLTQGGFLPPSSHDPSLYGSLTLLILISVPGKKGLHERGVI